MADRNVRAVGRIESLTPADEALKFRFERNEFALPCPNILKLCGKQFANVSARGRAFAAQLKNGGDFEQSEPSALPIANELKTREDRWVVRAVAVGVTVRFREQTPSLVEADGLGG